MKYSAKQLRDYWAAYRLGDMVKYKHWRAINPKSTAKEVHLRKYPDSIASKYMKMTDNECDLDILMQLVDQYKIEEFPQENEIVVHLRVGNVLLNNKYSIKDMLSARCNYVNNICYVFPISYYDNAIEHIPPNVKKVVIIAGGNINYSEQKDEEYCNAIKSLFENNGFEIAIRDYHIPDQDFVYMCNAKYFIPGGGGFSDLVKKIIEKKNGTIITDTHTSPKKTRIYFNWKRYLYIRPDLKKNWNGPIRATIHYYSFRYIDALINKLQKKQTFRNYNK